MVALPRDEGSQACRHRQREGPAGGPSEHREALDAERRHHGRHVRGPVGHTAVAAPVRRADARPGRGDDAHTPLPGGVVGEPDVHRRAQAAVAVEDGEPVRVAVGLAVDAPPVGQCDQAAVAVAAAAVARAQRFFQFGARFSANALGPSLASSLLKTSPESSDSIR